MYHTPGPFWRWPLKFRRVPTGVKGELFLGTSGGQCRYRHNERRNYLSGLHTLALPRVREEDADPSDLKNQTLSIRIAGVDAPEMAHFGNPAQPHAKESFDWLVKEVTGKVVRCQLLRKDQYNRIVGTESVEARG